MKRIQIFAMLSIAAFCALLLSPVKVYADSVLLTSVGYGSASGSGAGASSMYPYTFTVNGGPTTVNLMCLSYENDIELNESWTATITPITAFAGQDLTNYKEAAYIFSQMGVYGATDAQWANWLLLDPSDQLLLNTVYGLNGVTGLSAADQDAINALRAAAPLWVAANPDSTLYSDLVIYVPTDGSENPLADGTPQTLIGDAPTPEPSSLILLGSGLLLAAAFFYRKRSNGLKTASTQAVEISLPRV
jgi:hypothetical protein